MLQHELNTPKQYKFTIRAQRSNDQRKVILERFDIIEAENTEDLLIEHGYDQVSTLVSPVK